MSSFKPSEGAGGAGPMQAREEVASGFFVAGGDASELFDKIEKALDEIAFGVEGEVAIARDLAIRFWPDGRDKPGHDGLAKPCIVRVGLRPTANAIRAFLSFSASARTARTG